MKLVIDISEELYMEYVNLGTGKGTGILSQLIRAIKDGTPLPKGHGRLIDANEFNKYLISRDSSFKSLLSDIPTIIEADGGGE